MEPTQEADFPSGAVLDDRLARERELDALRIQAAAVAAQQAALTEEETRFEQRRAALDQQEKQLAAHLEEKRRQLLQLQDQVRKARAELHQQKKVHEQRLGAVASDLARERRELTDAQRQAKRERNRLIDLRRHLKHRWHRHWMAERQTLRRSEQAVADARHKLEKESERLRQDKEAFIQERLRFNGDSELSRRQLQDLRAELRQEQKQWREHQAQMQAEMHARALAASQRDTELAEAVSDLDTEKRHWQGTRLHLEREAEGLESRIRNHRRKLLDLEQEIKRLEGVVQARLEEGANDAAAAAVPGVALVIETVPSSNVPAIASVLSLPVECERHEQSVEAESELQDRLATLEQLAGDIADQRLHLAEQWQHLLRARHHWQEEHEAAAAGLETLALRLQEQERGQAGRERGLVVGETSLRQRLAEVTQLRHSLESCQGRLRSRVATWEGERDRLLVDIRAREQLAERRQQSVAAMRARWNKRRRVELERVQTALTAADGLHKDYAVLRDEYFQRQAALEHKERGLAEQALALEQFRLECTGQSEDSPAAEKHLERLRRRWAGLSAAAERTVARERQAIEAEAGRADDHYQQGQKLAREMAALEAKQAEDQTTFEHEQALAEDRYEQMRQDLQSMQAQRDRYERQVAELRDEIDRVARVLLGEDEPATIPLGQAA
jgi:chromosome segregation ATPase